MQAYTIYTLIALTAGSLTFVIPYLLRVQQDPNLKLDINYLYATIITMIGSVIVLIPKTEPFDVMTGVLLFLAIIKLNETGKDIYTDKIKGKSSWTPKTPGNNKGTKKPGNSQVT